MSGVYSAPRSKVLTSANIVQAIASLPEVEKAQTIINLEHLYNSERKKLIHFTEPSSTWYYESSSTFPQVGSVYVSRVEDQVLSTPLRIQAQWSNVGSNGLQVSFDRVRCAGFVILV